MYETYNSHLYDELPEPDPMREPKRSRLQLDITKHTRFELHQYARAHRTNPKRLVTEALAQYIEAEDPELAEHLRHESRMPGKTINRHITDVLEKG